MEQHGLFPARHAFILLAHQYFSTDGTADGAGRYRIHDEISDAFLAQRYDT